MTGRLFVSDKIKSIILSAVFGGAIYYGFMRILEWAGKDFYWYLLGGTVAVMILAVNLIPNFVMPLFNKYEPLPEG